MGYRDECGLEPTLKPSWPPTIAIGALVVLVLALLWLVPGGTP